MTTISRRYILALAAVAGISAVGGLRQSFAAPYTYTPTTATTTWSSGTGWSAVPVSATGTTLTYVATNTTVQPNSLANINTNNIATGLGTNGGFILNVLNLQGTGPASGAGSITINGTALELETTGTTAPAVNLNALAGAAGLTYTVNTPLLLDNNTTFQGTGTATFNFAGGVTFTGQLTKAGSSAMTLSGIGSGAGGLAINGGTINVVGTAGQNSLGTGAITVTNGTLGATANVAGTFGLGTGSVSTTAAMALSGSAGHAVAFTGANAATTSTFTYGVNGGLVDTLALNANGGSVSYTLGNAAPTAPVLVRSSTAVLFIQPSALSNLGSSEQVFVNGLASTTNTVYQASVLVQDTAANNFAADFVNYAPATGFEAGSLVAGAEVNQSATGLDTENSATVAFNVDQALPGALTANRQVYALRTSYSIDPGTGNTLTIGNAVNSVPAGLLLNGTGVVIGSGTDVGTLKFSAASTPGDAVIYTAQSATINSAITATGKLTFVGPGALTINGDIAVGSSSSILNFPGTVTINGPLSGTGGGFQFMGTGSLVLNADNSGLTGTVILGADNKTFSGATNLGTVTIGANNALGTGTLDLYNTAVATSQFVALTTSADVALANPTVNISINSGNFVSAIAVINGSGNLTLNGNVDLNGDFTSTFENDIATNHVLTFAGVAFVLQNQSSLTLDGTGAWVINSKVTDGGTEKAALTYSGAGSLTLNNNSNSFTQGLTISGGVAGTVIVGANNALGVGQLSLRSGTVGGPWITVQASAAVVLPNAIAIGSGANVAGVFAGANNITINGNASTGVAGATVINNMTGGAALSLGGSSFTLNSDVTFKGAANINISNNITGTGTTLTYNGTGILTLSGTNGYTGGTAINNGGTLKAGSAGALGFGGIVSLKAGSTGTTTVTAGSTLDLFGQTLVEPLVLNGGTLGNSGSAATLAKGVKGVGYSTTTTTISGDAAITFAAGGGGSGATATPLLGVNATSTFTGLSGGSGYGTTAPTVTISGGGTGATATAALTSGSVSSITITNAGVGYTSAPTITFSAPTTGVTATENGNDAFSLVAIQQTSAGSGYTSAPPVPTLSATTGSATLTTPVIASVTLTGTSNSIGGTGDIAINSIISGATGGFTKISSDTLTLNGVNTYGGATIVNGGTLLVNGSITSATTVNSTGTLGGSGTIAAGVELAAGSTLSPGNSPGQLTVNSLLLDSGSTTHMEIGGATLGTQYDNVNVTTGNSLTYGGTLQVVSFGGYDVSAQGGSYTLFSFTGSAGAPDFSAVTVDGFGLTDSAGVWSGTNGGANYTFTDSNGILNVTTSAVPEPASLALLALGAAALL